MTRETAIFENVQAIRERIAKVLGNQDRRVWLVAATKMNDAAAVRAAVAAGVDACGENRVQEFLEKDAQGAYTGCSRHFIGTLQQNKVNKIVGRVDLIQSVDSEALLRRIDRQAQSLGLCQDILIEINIGGEAQKSGIAPSALPALLEKAAALPGIFVRGLMCIPPVLTLGGDNRRYFSAMTQLFVDNSEKKYDNVSMDFLSMGMTEDYADAITEGANMVRVGTGIFGARHYENREA